MLNIPSIMMVMVMVMMMGSKMVVRTPTANPIPMNSWCGRCRHRTVSDRLATRHSATLTGGHTDSTVKAFQITSWKNGETRMK